MVRGRDLGGDSGKTGRALWQRRHHGLQSPEWRDQRTAGEEVDRRLCLIQRLAGRGGKDLRKAHVSGHHEANEKGKGEWNSPGG